MRLNNAKTIFMKTKNIIALVNNSGILKGAIARES